MSNENNRFTELCAGHVLNALSEIEEQEFQRLLSQADAEQLQLLDEMRTAASELATLTSGETPSPTVKQKIMQVAKESASKKSSYATIYKMTWYRLAAAAAVLFVFTSIGLVMYSTGLQEEVQNKETLISQQQSTIERLETEVQRKEELLTILEARNVDLVMMDGLAEMSPNGYGKVVWDKEGGNALLQVANIPSVPIDKDYQLWFIVNGQPISAGVFAVDDPESDNFFKIEQLQSSADEGAFAITMEPKGGVPQPTGDMYLLGNM
ncbi:MAG: anti-sigma factor [Gracilimonas sp.]